MERKIAKTPHVPRPGGPKSHLGQEPGKEKTRLPFSGPGNEKEGWGGGPSPSAKSALADLIQQQQAMLNAMLISTIAMIWINSTRE